jgi:hypothetical protein
MHDFDPTDVKKGVRKVENDAKEAWRNLDGEAASDKLANVGDDVRDEIDNAKDELDEAAKRQRETERRCGSRTSANSRLPVSPRQ